MRAATANYIAGWLGDTGVTFVALAAFVFLGACVLLLAILLLSRRRLQREIREIVLSVEELRAGRGRRRAEIDRHSPLLHIGDAVNRLSQDLHVRLADSAETHERLQAVMDALRDSAVVSTDLDADVRSFSDGAVRLLGWEEDEVLSRPAAMLFADGAYEKLLPRLTRRSERERGIRVRSALKRKDGSTFAADIVVRTLHRPSREANGFVMVIQDVTAQVRMEQQLRDSESRYRSLVEGLSEGVVIVRGGNLIYANPAFGELCGVPDEHLVGSPLRERIATRDLLMVEETLARLERSTGHDDSMVCALVDPQGRPRAEVRLIARTIEFAGLPAVLVLVYDESSRRRVEAELRHNEARLDAVIEATSDGILVLSEGPQGGVAQMTNRAFGEYFGFAESELLGQPLPRLVQRLRERGGGHAALATLLDIHGRDRLEQPIRIGGPRPRELRASLLPLVGRDGSPIGRVVACRDLTAERESQRRLQQHADELQLSKVKLEQAYRHLDSMNRDLQSRSEELDRLNQELRTLDEMKSNLLGNVSHELQTPLVSIRGYSEMILKGRLGPVTEEQRKGLTLCLKNIDRLIAMIDNLLSLARSRPDLTRLDLTRFPLRPLIDEAADMLRDEIRDKRLRLAIELPPDTPSLQADRDKVLQVFINLLSNAVKFNRQGGSIEVRAVIDAPGFVVVDVIDSGVGIAPEAIDRVFERHYRAAGDVDREAAPAGSGLGLAIVRDILRLHGCRIEVHSRLGEGTRFTFTLPLASQMDQSQTPDSDSSSAGASQSRDAASAPPSDRPAGPAAPKPDRPARRRFRIIRRDKPE